MLLEEDRIRVLHMIEAARAALDFIAQRQPRDLDNDTMFRFALVRAIEILGEAASRMSKTLRESSPDIPWSRIISMRNRLVHAYFDINQEILWKTANEELPRLLPRLQSLIDRE